MALRRESFLFPPFHRRSTPTTILRDRLLVLCYPFIRKRKTVEVDPPTVEMRPTLLSLWPPFSRIATSEDNTTTTPLTSLWPPFSRKK
jgi:hypothetical protein